MLANRSNQRGLSLVELMVGIAVGMFVVAAATTVITTQLTDNRRLLLEVQVQQDLRAAMDFITRDLRRAGSWQDTIDTAAEGVDSEAADARPNGNLLQMEPATPGSSNLVRYKSSRTPKQNGPYGFIWEKGDEVTKKAGHIRAFMKGDDDTGQQLTDPLTLNVTNFQVTRHDEPPIRISCSKKCSPEDTTLLGDARFQYCWPTLVVTSFDIQITGQAVADENVVRTLHSRVRLRNDAVNFNDPTNPNQACPT